MAALLAHLKRIYLPDWLFFPAAAALAACLIVLAFTLNQNTGSALISDTGFVVQGEALADLVAGPGTSVRFDPNAPDGPAARMRASASFELAGNMSAGVAAFAPNEFETRISGKRIRVVVEARTTGANPPSHIKIGYFIVGYSGTGWQDVPIGPEYTSVSVEWDATDISAGQYREAIGIWPDIDGQNREILVRRMRVEILPRHEP